MGRVAHFYLKGRRLIKMTQKVVLSVEDIIDGKIPKEEYKEKGILETYNYDEIDWGEEHDNQNE